MGEESGRLLIDCEEDRAVLIGMLRETDRSP
jgi:hypothetical protein